MQTTTETPVTETKSSAQKAKRTNKNLPIVLLIVLLLAGGAGAYWWRDKEAKAQAKKQAAEISTLQARVSQLEALDAAKSERAADVSDAVSTTVPTAAVKENIIASIKSDNTAALEGYMAPTVRVIIAASDGIGDRTPTQAVSDLEYLDSATDPWDFALPEATLSGWQSGSYDSYFPSNAVVGRSADGKVVSFTFDSAGKIIGVFMSANDDLN
jgi:hypothetical protein